MKNTIKDLREDYGKMPPQATDLEEAVLGAMLLSSEAREKVFELGRSMTYLELSNEPGYMDEFVAACFLPHTDRSLFPSVSQE